MVSIATISGRSVCQQCGGWAELSSVAAEFATLHDHPVGAPVIYRLNCDPAAWTVPGLLAAAPVAGRLVAFVGGKTIRESRRIVVQTPNELKSLL